MSHELSAQLLIALALLKGVARAVAILIEGERTVRKRAAHIILYDGFLVFDGHIVAPRLFVDRDAAVPGNVKVLSHLLSPLRYFSNSRLSLQTTENFSVDTFEVTSPRFAISLFMRRTPFLQLCIYTFLRLQIILYHMSFRKTTGKNKGSLQYRVILWNDLHFGDIMYNKTKIV